MEKSLKEIKNTLTKKDMESIRKKLDDKTQDAFKKLDKMRHVTWLNATHIKLD